MLFNFYQNVPNKPSGTQTDSLKDTPKDSSAADSNYDTKMYLEMAIFSFFIKKFDKLTLQFTVAHNHDHNSEDSNHHHHGEEHKVEEEAKTEESNSKSKNEISIIFLD